MSDAAVITTLGRRSDARPNAVELEWAKRSFPRVIASIGRRAISDLVYLKRDLQHSLRSTDSELDKTAILICKVMASTSESLTRVEILQKARALSGESGTYQTAKNRSYFERPGAPRGDAKSLLRQGFVRVSVIKGNKLHYELTEAGLALAQAENGVG